MIESKKLSTKNINSVWPILSYRNISNVDIINWDDIDRRYDLEHSHIETRNLSWICNQVIHSFVFVLNFQDDGKFAGFYVSSDKCRNKFLYMIQMKEISKILKLIGDDYPANSYIKRDESGDFTVLQW